MLIKLSELKYGDCGVIRMISSQAYELASLGIRLDKSVRMITCQPIKGPVVVMVNEIEVALGVETAGQVLVELENEEMGES